MGKPHTDALVAATQEVSQLHGRTFVTQAPRGTLPPYIVWHPAKGRNTQDRVSGPKATKNPRFTGHIVGEDADQVLYIADLLEDKLFPGGRGIVIIVPGERAKPLWFESPLPVQVQDDPQPTIVYLIVEVGWASSPA